MFQEVTFQAKKNKNNEPQENFLYFLKRKLFLYSREQKLWKTERQKTFYISGNNFLNSKKLKKTTLNKFLIFPEVTFKAWKSKIVNTFSYKDAKFSKLKYFLMIMVRHFFSFYIIFLYTQQAFVFHLLRYFCNVHDHIATSLLFFL